MKQVLCIIITLLTTALAQAQILFSDYSDPDVCEGTEGDYWMTASMFNKDGIHQGGWVAHQFLCFQERGAYGRILHLLDVNWKDGWPMMKQRPHTPSPQLSTPNCQLTIPIYSQHYT